MSTTRKATGLRRSVLDAKSRRNEKRGQGWRGSYRDRHDISKAEDEDILLTRGEYPDPENVDEKTQEPRLAHYHTCKMHGVKLKPRGEGAYYASRCNIDAGQEDCLLCMRKTEGDRRITDKTTFSFNIIHLGLYQQIELERDGRVVRYEEGENRGKPVMIWDLVDRPSDQKRIMKDLDQYLKDGEVKLFRKKYIEVGVGHRDELAAIDEMASKFCKCGGELTPVTFLCEECDEVLADVDKDDMTKKEVTAFAQSRTRCPACGHTGIPVPENVCDSCKNPEPLTAFDVVATIRKEGEGTGTHIVVKKITPLDQYTLPNGDYLIEWEEEKGQLFPKLDERDDFVFAEDGDLRKAVTAQWNFEEVHTPRDHEYHATKLGCSNPFPPSAGTNKYKRYGGKDESRSRIRDEEPEDEKPRERGRRGREEEEAPPERGRRGREEEPPAGTRRRSR